MGNATYRHAITLIKPLHNNQPSPTWYCRLIASESTITIPILGILIAIRKKTAPTMNWTKFRVWSTLRHIAGHAWQSLWVSTEFGIQWQWYWLELRDSQTFMANSYAVLFTTVCRGENGSMCCSDIAATATPSSEAITAVVLCRKLSFNHGQSGRTGGQGGRLVLETPDASSGWWKRLNSVQGSYGIDCQSAISIRPIVDKIIPKIVIMRLFSLIVCKIGLWKKRGNFVVIGSEIHQTLRTPSVIEHQCSLKVSRQYNISCGRVTSKNMKQTSNQLWNSHYKCTDVCRNQQHKK